MESFCWGNNGWSNCPICSLQAPKISVRQKLLRSKKEALHLLRDVGKPGEDMSCLDTTVWVYMFCRKNKSSGLPGICWNPLCFSCIWALKRFEYVWYVKGGLMPVKWCLKAENAVWLHFFRNAEKWEKALKYRKKNKQKVCRKDKGRHGQSKQKRLRSIRSSSSLPGAGLWGEVRQEACMLSRFRPGCAQPLSNLFPIFNVSDHQSPTLLPFPLTS